jgi:hypothetical protein
VVRLELAIVLGLVQGSGLCFGLGYWLNYGEG